MRDLASIELHALALELKGKLESARFKNFYETGEDSFLLAVTKDGKETDVYLRLRKALNETSFKEQQAEPTSFALAVRKKLDNLRIESFGQYGMDRILVIGFSGKEEKLVVEMFGKGNVLYVGKDNITELVYKTQSYRERELRKNMVYKFPAGESLGPEEITAEKVNGAIEDISGSEGKLISALGSRINFGPLYLEDIILRSGLDPNAKACDQKVSGGSLAAEILNVYEHSKKPEPRVYSKAGAPIDFAILPITKYENDASVEKAQFGTVSELLDDLYLKERSTGLDPAKVREIEELSSSLAKLKVQMAELKETDKLYAEVGGKIFEHMGDINALIGQIKKSKPRKADEIGAIPEGMAVKSLDPKNKTVKIEVE